MSDSQKDYESANQQQIKNKKNSPPRNINSSSEQSSDQQAWYSTREKQQQQPICRKRQKHPSVLSLPLANEKKITSKRSKDSILQEIWEKLQIATFFPKFSYSLFKQLMINTNEKMKLIHHDDITKDRLEFLGDRVLKMIHGRIAFEYMETSGDATRLINILESNRVFACYLEKINNICTALGKKIKRCADLFEVIVGAIFYTYFYMDGDYNIIQKIEQWMQHVTIFSEHLTHILRTGLKKDVLCKL